MGLEDLKDFLNERGQINKEKEVNWEAEKIKWIDTIEQFYAQINTWLSSLEKSKLKIDYQPITIYEEKLGSYQVRKMIITLLNQTVTLEPVGTILIGVHGRIDLKGSKGTLKFILVPRKSDGPKIKVLIREDRELPPFSSKEEDENQTTELVWKVTTPPPNIKYYALDSDVFSDAFDGGNKIMSRISLSYQNKDITEIIDWYDTTKTSLQEHLNLLRSQTRTSDVGTEKFIGYTVDELEKHFSEVRLELENIVCLDLLSAIEASLKRDYIQRINYGKEDDLSKFYLSHSRIHKGEVANRIILEAWEKYHPQTKRIIRDYKAALKFRNWLAHGRLWEHRYRVYDVDTLYPICDNIISNLPLFS